MIHYAENTMKRPIVTLVAAHGRNREIGVDNRLPWHITEEFQYFKELTRGHTVLMGSKTARSIGKPLKGRTNLVLTGDVNLQFPGATCVHSIEEALNSTTDDELMILGGQSIYEQFMPIADRMYISYIAQDYPQADTFFPVIDIDIFDHKWSEIHHSDDGKIVLFTVLYYERSTSHS